MNIEDNNFIKFYLMSENQSSYSMRNKGVGI